MKYKFLFGSVMLTRREYYARIIALWIYAVLWCWYLIYFAQSYEQMNIAARIGSGVVLLIFGPPILDMIRPYAAYVKMFKAHH